MKQEWRWTRHLGRVSQWMYARLALAMSMTVAVCQSILGGCSTGQVSQWLYTKTSPVRLVKVRDHLLEILDFQGSQ